MSRMTRAELAAYVDHTLLKPEATPADVLALAAEARDLAAYSICISPNMLNPAVLGGPLELGAVKLATVCGFPSGKHESQVKAAEAALAVEHGADEVDMVIDVGALKSGNTDSVTADIRAVREAIPSAILKVIIESAALSDDEIVAACRAAEAAMADFVKTSTGFHPSGGASVEAVRLMRETVGDRLGVKASGGIRDYKAAVAMIEAGASRLGLSGTATVLEGCKG
ncbi:deoxyribose-phosphate aldolase [Enemella dayhoffiae]|uniref:Deoxyribose-phosphate aldolase n=1 Tax=Enemella dayhoffiae TaxID=2016507 RepID=A0A255GVJ7_9ACTN|nr:deoxyribose-phosphate aldolase [Enemella dayhoffiae]OYO18683.1 deoxyribose-phosphate aldolase [Enemella dayhoffiae]